MIERKCERTDAHTIGECSDYTDQTLTGDDRYTDEDYRVAEEEDRLRAGFTDAAWRERYIVPKGRRR